MYDSVFKYLFLSRLYKIFYVAVFLSFLLFLQVCCIIIDKILANLLQN